MFHGLYLDYVVDLNFAGNAFHGLYLDYAVDLNLPETHFMASICVMK